MIRRSMRGFVDTIRRKRLTDSQAIEQIAKRQNELLRLLADYSVRIYECNHCAGYCSTTSSVNKIACLDGRYVCCCQCIPAIGIDETIDEVTRVTRLSRIWGWRPSFREDIELLFGPDIPGLQVEIDLRRKRELPIGLKSGNELFPETLEAISRAQQ